MTVNQMLVETLLMFAIRLTPIACILFFISLPTFHFMAALIMFVLAASYFHAVHIGPLLDGILGDAIDELGGAQ
ncbi:hypothetical protein RI570_06600 [Brucella pseudogrignonensis]|uniref:hypothetical protein n=1 Tax=Brucella pseudogrignonensis TaxID=419475 RepID=UPI0028B6B110|nr:hypothetical protein [Brucella pseudogrignonensis]MDT6939813.1 hypothetical protein [Brucella pseudogrignonensis]